jgi:hypothetical protein
MKFPLQDLRLPRFMILMSNPLDYSTHTENIQEEKNKNIENLSNKIDCNCNYYSKSCAVNFCGHATCNDRTIKWAIDHDVKQTRLLSECICDRGSGSSF